MKTVTSFWVLSLVDTIMTIFALSIGAQELNPLYEAMGPSMFWAYKILGAVLVGVVALKFQKAWMVLPLVAFYGFIVTTNAIELVQMVG